MKYPATPAASGKRPGTIIITLVLFAGTVLVSSCSMKQAVTLKRDGSGTASFRVTLSPTLMAASKDLSSGSTSTTPPGQFDIPAIRKEFSKNSALVVDSLSSPSPGVLSGHVHFADIRKVFASQSELSGSDVVTYSRGKTDSTLRVHITRQNFAHVAVLAGMSDNPFYQMFGPEQNAATSQEDLDQMMTYVLGENGPKAMNASSIDISITVDGKILSHTGGSVSGNTVDFRIPLVELMLLNKPLDYSVTFS